MKQLENQWILLKPRKRLYDIHNVKIVFFTNKVSKLKHFWALGAEWKYIYVKLRVSNAYERKLFAKSVS